MVCNTVSHDQQARCHTSGTGSSISVYGTVGRQSLGAPPCGVFSLESKTAVNTTSRFVPHPALNDSFHQLFFASPAMAPGEHTLTMRIDTSTDECGDTASAMTPIWADFLQVDPGDTSSSSASTLAYPQPSASSSLFGLTEAATSLSSLPAPTLDTKSAATVPVSVVAGSIVATVVVLTVLVSILLWRRRLYASRHTRLDSGVSPFTGA